MTARRWPKRIVVWVGSLDGLLKCYAKTNSIVWDDERIYQLVPKAKRRKTKKNPPRP